MFDYFEGVSLTRQGENAAKLHFFLTIGLLAKLEQFLYLFRKLLEFHPQGLFLLESQEFLFVDFQDL